jgi:hypothetical protein
MKMSKTAKGRMKRLNKAQAQAALKAAALLADLECITDQRFTAIRRTLESCMKSRIY